MSTARLQPPVEPDEWLALLTGRHSDPSRLLGPRVLGRDPVRGTLTHHVRTFLPQASRAWLVHTDAAGARVSQPMRRTHRSGIYEAIVTTAHQPA